MINNILSEQSRRDDLESIGYVLIYLFKGCLPWQGIKVKKNEDKYKRIYEKKKQTSPKELAQGLPSKYLKIKKGEFSEYVNYTRNLEFVQEPDYNYLKNLFKSVMKKFNYIYDFKFDWTNEYNMSRSKSKY